MAHLFSPVHLTTSLSGKAPGAVIGKLLEAL